ncbi:hypothetical protein [Robbsia sp. KACC 23696]|uniref:hypothetical protein n=1 Tax=Robbsia sp. KACC 23696 TaxID=3149231 RepID=UPI00325AA865
MEIQEFRRARLRKWLETHSAPQKEKSYFSQLASGSASFGERAARRIERAYGMGHLYLDGDFHDGQAVVLKAEPARILSGQAEQLIEEIKAADHVGIPPEAFSAISTLLRHMSPPASTDRAAGD